MSYRHPMTFLLAWLGLGWALACGPTTLAEASTRSETAAVAQAGIARVDSLMEAGQDAAAVQEARRLSELLAADPLYGWQIEGRLGLALLRAGYPTEALPYLEAVMRRNLNDHAAHRNFAAALRATGKRGRALSEYGLAVELAPGDFETRLEYGQFLAEFGDVQEARNQLEIARSLCPDCPEADPVLAGILLGAADFEAAVDPLRRIMDREPTLWARRSLGQALAGAGRDRELLDFLDSFPFTDLSAEEMTLAVEAEGRLGLADRSLACLGSSADPGGKPGGLDGDLLTDHGFWGKVSLNLLEAGYCDEALIAADRAVELDGRNVVYRNNRVVILLKLGRSEEAAREWEEVLLLDPALGKKDNE